MYTTGNLLHTNGGGMLLKRQDSQELTMKKLTLTAWTRILCKQGMIDIARANRMEAMIQRLTESAVRTGIPQPNQTACDKQ